MAQVLQPLNTLFPIENYPELLVGLGRPDDSAVYKIDDERALISTVDFFPPVVDAPYDFGAIAAANALSDVYAMGGEPLFAINLAAFPDGLDLDILTEILRGGGEKVREAGAVIAGGHTITDKEPKYGLAVTGVVHPDGIITKGGAKPGDKLILTKKLGTGVVTTALQLGEKNDTHLQAAIESMSHLNKTASQIAQEIGVHAMTDITGYSLIGHTHEMMHLSQTAAHINLSTLQWLPGTQEYGEKELNSGGMGRNLAFYGKWVQFGAGISIQQQNLLYDSETSGGLLMAVAEDKSQNLYDQLLAAGETASIIGEVGSGHGEIFISR
ncbi:MAG: selenide, water dikinase SelD [Chloroflexi bacterium]|nr:MAG: selenide, water dikinase SelD [Phototrophicales bacterium]RMF76680.1 MAG: selenide, water dikinase SelD [Chloroflexota bacterium]